MKENKYLSIELMKEAVEAMAKANPTKAGAKARGVLLNVNTKGNLKLINKEDAMFIIWNIPAVITCPYRTALCEASCYALKAERLYPSVKASRLANYEASKADDFAVKMVYTILKETEKTPNKNIVFRIHESGDFYNKEYLNKWLQVARYFEATQERHIVFMAYTKSVSYFLGVSKPSNWVNRFSDWEDTDEEQRAIARALELPVYTAVKKGYDFEGNNVIKCECKDCMTCGKCWDESNKVIACIIH